VFFHSSLQSLFISLLTLSLFYYPTGAATIRPQDFTSSIAHQGNASISTSEEVTHESAKKTQQANSTVKQDHPYFLSQLEALIQNKGVLFYASLKSLFRSCLTLSLLYYPPGAATTHPQDNASSISHESATTASNKEEVAKHSSVRPCINVMSTVDSSASSKSTANPSQGALLLHSPW
jgi:hypothetical protein